MQPTCTIIQATLVSTLAEAKVFFNEARNSLITQKTLELNDKISKQNLITSKHFENFEVIKTIKGNIALEQKKNTFLQNKNNKIDEIESDILILENELSNIKNELLLIESGIKK